MFFAETAVEQFLDDSGFELRTGREVEPIETFDRAELGTLEDAQKFAFLSPAPLGAQQQDGEIRVGPQGPQEKEPHPILGLVWRFQFSSVLKIGENISFHRDLGNRPTFRQAVNAL